MSPTMKTVGDLVTSIEKFLQIPYWFSARQSLAMAMHIGLESEGLQYEPCNVLVFDQEYQLIGELDPGRMLGNLRQSLPEELQNPPADGNMCQSTWKDLTGFCESTLEELLVGDVMTHIGDALAPSDTILHAFYSLAGTTRTVAAVIDGGQLVGVVRRADVIAELLTM